MTSSRPRFAFTLVELLIVINIVALLVAISLPAVVYALESARRIQCQANLRQIGVALQGYSSSHSVFPPAVIWTRPGLIISKKEFLAPGTVDLSTDASDGWKTDLSRSGVFVALLPYFEQSVIAEQWNYDLPATAPENETARSEKIGLLVCPSDAGSMKLPVLTAAGKWARSNYAVNAGPDPLCTMSDLSVGVIKLSNASCRTLYPLAYDVRGVEVIPPSPLTMIQLFGSGVAGVNKCFAPADLTDGLSRTVAFEEIIGSSEPKDRRGVWAMPYIGSSITFGHGRWSGAGFPNPVGIADIIQDGSDKFDPPSDGSRKASIRSHARSKHPGGVNTLMADGSVQFIHDDVDPKVWTASHTRSSSDDLAVPAP